MSSSFPAPGRGDRRGVVALVVGALAVALLDIAARGNCIDALARRIDAALDAGQLPDVTALKDEFLPTTRTQRDVTIPPPDLCAYNSLLASVEVH